MKHKYSNLSNILDSNGGVQDVLKNARYTAIKIIDATAIELYLHAKSNNVPECDRALMDDSFIFTWNVVYRDELLSEGMTIIPVEHEKVLNWLSANRHNTIYRALVNAEVPE